jgi:fumarate hydratase, class II
MTSPNDKEPKILDVPIGLAATGMRREFDSLGDVEVPANRYWGAQTQRISTSAMTGCRKRCITPTAT